MLPREIISRSWRPISGTLVLPPTQRLLCVLSNGQFKAPQPFTNKNNKFLKECAAVNFCFAAAAASSMILNAAPCHSEEAVIQQTQQNLTRPIVPIMDMPTPLIDESQKPNQNQEKSAGTGAPQQRGKVKYNPWKRRQGNDFAHSRIQALELARARRGPPTPTFPEGVPFERIRMMAHVAQSSHVNVKYRKHKIYKSLKRGR